MNPPTQLNVQVHYPAAAQPFHDAHADPQETVGHLKGRVLAAFGLTEGPTPDGNVVAYQLFQGKQVLEDPNQPIGSLVEHGHALQLKLVQQITQGTL